MKTKVIFRTWHRTGEVIAIFPEVPHDRAGDFAESYMHTGQHGAASPTLDRVTRPATAAEAAPLKRELEAIGYDLTPVLRVSFRMHKARRAAAREALTPRPAMNLPACHHAAGYWIKRGESFRCYSCGHQLRLSEIAPRRDRRIETWKATPR